MSDRTDRPGAVEAHHELGARVLSCVPAVDHQLGPNDTSNTNLVVGLPSGTTLIDAQPDVGTCSSDGAQLTCELGAIVASTSVTVSVSVRAENAGALEFAGSVSADQLDPSAANNAATLSVSVEPSADLNLAASLAPTTVNVGDATDLSLTVRNDGPSDASNVHLVATLPTGKSLDDAANLAACTETPTGLRLRPGRAACRHAGRAGRSTENG